MRAPILLLKDNIPKAYSRDVDLFQVHDDFEQDMALQQWVMMNNPSLEDLTRVWCRQFDWACFWSVRHWDPEVRDLFAASVEAGREEAAEITKLIEAAAAKRGVDH